MERRGEGKKEQWKKEEVHTFVSTSGSLSNPMN